MKFLYTWLIISLGFLVPIYSQALINWPLSPAHLGNPVIIENDLIGFPFERGNGLSILTFTGSGVGAKNWSPGIIDESAVDFYEFGAKALPGKTIEITKVLFKERRSSTGPRNFSVYYSRDDFNTQTLLETVSIPDNIASRGHEIIVNLKVADGEEIRFRFYGFNSEGLNGGWGIRANSLSLHGHSLASCSAPSSPASINITSINSTSIQAQISAGNGQARLIVIGPEAFDMPVPYQGAVYTGDQVFGQGDSLAYKTYVIATTSLSAQTVNVTGLEEGAFYKIAVYEYSLGNMCYNITPATTDFMTNCTAIPKQVQEVDYSAIENRVAIQWEPLNCFDKYLVLASDHPIVGTPSGTSFSSNRNYGVGTPAAGFGPNVYAVLFTNSDNDVLVKNLVNGTTYYFAIYTLIGTQWSTAYTFNATPEEGCPGQNHERVFINEFHYYNNVITQDQGIEIAGPANLDLSNYEIMIWDISGGIIPTYLTATIYPLFGIIDDEGTGLGAVWFPIPDMPTDEGGIVLRNRITGGYIHFLGYSSSLGIREASSLNGPILASATTLVETNFDPAGFSLQRIGTGSCPLDYTWAKMPHTRGVLNANQLILPVILTAFGAEVKGDVSRVYWQTMVEEGSDYFIIEHSTNGRRFDQVGKVKAAGFSQELIDYQFMDFTPTPGLNYYRLKQQDFDGTIQDFGIVTVRFDKSGKETLLVFPNPVDKQATITWEGKAEILKLSDANGRLLRTIALEGYVDGGSRTMNMGELPKGAYYLRLESRDRIETFTVVKN